MIVKHYCHSHAFYQEQGRKGLSVQCFLQLIAPITLRLVLVDPCSLLPSAGRYPKRLKRPVLEAGIRFDLGR